MASYKNYLVSLSLVIVQPGLTLQSSQAEPTKTVRYPANGCSKDFDRFLKSLKDAPLDERIRSLKEFLEDNPDVECAYQTLFDQFTIDGKVQDAKAYFNRLSKKSPFYRNSFWMLAKTKMKSDPEAAFNDLMKALNGGILTPALLIDAVSFNHRHKRKFELAGILRKAGANPEILTLTNALYDYYKGSYKSVLKTIQKLPESVRHDTNIIYIWGNSLNRLNRYDEAVAIWQPGIKLARENGESKIEAKLLANLGLLENYRYNYELASAHFDSAHAIADQIHDVKRRQTVARYRAYNSADQGHHVKAEQQFIDAIRLASKPRDESALVDLYKGLAGTSYYLAKYDRALVFADSCAQLAKSLNNQRYEILINMDKIVYYTNLKQGALAKQLIHETAQLASAIDLPYYQKLAQARLGDIDWVNGQVQEARHKYLEFIEYLNEDPNLKKRTFTWYGKLARTYYFEKKYGKAKETYLKALAAAHEAESASFQGLYELRLGDVEQALGNHKKAHERYDLAKQIATENDATDLLWEIYYGYGRTFKQMGRMESAISAYRDAINVIEKTRFQLKSDPLRIGYFIESFQVYQDLVDCYKRRFLDSASVSDLDSLLYYYQLSQNRVFRENTSHKARISSSRSTAYQQSSANLQEIQRRIREYVSRTSSSPSSAMLSQLEIARYTLQAQKLRMFDVEQKENGPPPEPIYSQAELLRLLGKLGRGLLLYQIVDNNSFAIAATGDDLRIIPLAVQRSRISAQIDSLVAPFHEINKASARSVPFYAGIAFKLYTSLFKPIEDAIELPEKLTILASSVVFNLPFEMLLLKRPEKSVFTPADSPTYSRKFLGHRYSVTYSPSVSLLKASPAVETNPHIAVLANPFPVDIEQSEGTEALRSRLGWRFLPLPFSSKEAEAIKTINPNTAIFERGKASLSTLIENAASSQILHIATHAFSDSIFSDFAGLVLAVSDPTDDGILMGYEIPELALECDLVALSACETARGTLIPGEGALGLPRQFLAAGAKSVLMTHWKVDDWFASEMIPEFYHQYLKKGLSKGEALSTAKRKSINVTTSRNALHYQHPFFWASFVLYGDSGTARESSIALLGVCIFILVVFSGFLLKYSRKVTRQDSIG